MASLLSQQWREPSHIAFEANDLNAVIRNDSARLFAVREKSIRILVVDHRHFVAALHEGTRQTLNSDGVTAEAVRRIKGCGKAEAQWAQRAASRMAASAA